MESTLAKIVNMPLKYLTTMLLNEMQKQYHRAETQAEVIKTHPRDMKAHAEVMKVQQQEIEGLEAEPRLQDAAFRERLSRLQSIIGTQTQVAPTCRISENLPCNRQMSRLEAVVGQQVNAAAQPQGVARSV